MTRVLVTNDDGISAPGLRRLAAAAVQRGLEVVVAAPLDESSGVSAALTAVVDEGRVMIEQRTLRDVDGVTAFAVGASPAYIVVLGTLGAFGPAPDLVLSGINRGANAGNAVLHSGTVGATLTAASAGVHAMAVSLDVLTPAASSAATGGAAIAALDTVDDETRHWDTAADLAGGLLDALTSLPAGTVLNLNVPDSPPAEVRGIRRAALARFGQVQMTIAEAAAGYVRTSVQQSEFEPDPGTDLAYLADGWATVTPIRTVSAADSVELDLPEPP
ncbi:MAG: 5'/3'-nucleotidase SurE [Jiangellaceae bacterium]